MTSRLPRRRLAAQVRARISSAGSAAYSENGRASDRGSETSVFIQPSVVGLCLERLPLRVTAVERVPVRHLVLAELPAQEHQPIAGQRVEIHQALVEILDHAAAAMDPGDVLGDRIGQRVALIVELSQLLSVGIALGRSGHRERQHLDAILELLDRSLAANQSLHPWMNLWKQLVGLFHGEGDEVQAWASSSVLPAVSAVSNEFPHPQERTALGLWIEKPLP